MMNRSARRDARWIIAVAALVGVGAPALAQQAINSQPAIRRNQPAAKAPAAQPAPARTIRRSTDSLPARGAPADARRLTGANAHTLGQRPQAPQASAPTQQAVQPPRLDQVASGGTAPGDPAAINQTMRGARARAWTAPRMREVTCSPARSAILTSNPEAVGNSADRVFSAPRSCRRINLVNPEGVDDLVRQGAATAASKTGAPALASVPAQTDFEKAGARLYDGKPEEAIVLLRSYTEGHPDDTEAARALALALLDARRTKEGVELMAQTYERDPVIAAVPIPADAVGPGREMRDIVVRVVEHAYKANTAGAWLTAAMLMQGEGRTGPALKMLDRADARGLRADLSSAMRTALKP